MLSIDSVSEKYKRRALDKTSSQDEAKASSLIVEAESHLEEEENEDGLAKATEALGLFTKVDDKVGVADAVRIAVHVMIYQDKRKEASLLVEEELPQVDGLEDGGPKAKLLLAMAEINSDCRGKAKRAEGLEQATEALNLFRELGDRKMEASAILTIAAIHMKRRPDKMAGAVDAFSCCSDSLRIARALSDRRAEACALHGFAVSSIQMAFCDPSLCLRTVLYDPIFEDGIHASREALRHWQDLGCKAMEASELQCLAQWQLATGNAEQALSDAAASVQASSNGHRSASLAVHVQALLANGNAEEALQLSEEALEESRSQDDKHGELQALNMLSHTHRSMGRLQEAYECCEEALDIIRDQEDVINEMRMQCAMGHIALERKEFDLVRDAADEMLRMAEELDDNKNQAVARHLISEVHRLKGDTDQYLKETRLQQKLFQEADDEKGLALALLDEGDARFRKAEFQAALEAVTKAQDIYKKHGDKTGEAHALHMIVEIQQILSDGDAVLKAASRQRSLLKSTGDKKGEAAAALTTCFARLSQLRRSGLEKGRSDYEDIWMKAFREAKDSLSLANNIGDESFFARAFYMLAEVYIATDGKGNEALDCASQAAKLFRETEDVKGEASAKVTIGRAHHLLGASEEAMSATKEAKALFTNLGDQAGIKTAEEALRCFDPRQWQESSVQLREYAEEHGVRVNGSAVAQPAPDMSSENKAKASSAALPSAKLTPEDVSRAITEVFLNITMLDDDLEGDAPLMEAGLTSNTVVLLRSELSRTFPGKHMPFTLVFDFPTANAIADFICDDAE